MIDSLGRFVFRSMDAFRQTGILDCLRELDGSQWWSPERLRAGQDERLRRLAVHAASRVPFYRQTFAAAGIDPRAVRSIADLGTLPAVSKTTIMARPTDFLDPTPEERFSWDVTSGSTGSPMRFRRSVSAGAWHRAFNLRNLAWFGVQPGEKQARVWGVPIRLKDRWRERVKDLLLNRMRYPSFDLGDGAVAQLLRTMARQRPRFLFGYPSAIHALARFALDGRRAALGDWRPCVVMTTSEMLFPDQRADIEEAFEAPVTNEYGASELTIMASSCPEGSLHLNDEAVITEFEPTTLEIDGAMAYRLIFTDLNNFSMPFIRYSIQDLGRPLPGPCPCGRGLARISLVGGREVDVLRTPSGRTIHGSIFSYLGKSILSAGGVRAYRAVQTALDRVEIQYVRGDGFDPSCLKRMREAFRERAGMDIDLDFSDVPVIPAEASGKLRYFYSRLRS